MKKNILLFSLGILFMGGMLHAQIPMQIPNGSFEQWSSHQGYGVSIMGYNMPIYDTFSTPSAWDYMSYPVNESIMFIGFPITINTSIPLIKASRATGQVPDGNTAVKLQTIMVEDIVDPGILSLASGSIDQSLLQTVFPSVLSTGVIDVQAFMPIVTSLLSGMGSLDSLLPSLVTMNVNDFISGGLALGEFEPSYLTGSYKYQSATSGDNGGVVILGTRYNSATHHRDIVGGGVNVALTDIGVYTPFTVEYIPLSDIQPGTPELAPDSLIVLILSSAGNNRQQGSMLYMDNLTLWQDTTHVECAEVLNLELDNQVYDAFPEMVLLWNGNSEPDHWEVEYGPQGFELGTGTRVETTNNYFEIHLLEDAGVLSPNTWYDFYVRSVCEDDIYGEWDSVHYRAFCAQVSNPVVNGDNISVTYDNKISGYTLSWVDNTDTRHWGVYYGIYDSQFPDNWGTYVEVDTPYFEFSPLRPNQTYSVEISAHCSEDNYGDVVWINFTTRGLEAIENADAVSLAVVPNPAHGQCEVSVSNNQPAEFKLYGLDGRLLQSAYTNGESVVLRLPSQGIFLLHAITSAGTTTYKIVSK